MYIFSFQTPHIYILYSLSTDDTICDEILIVNFYIKTAFLSDKNCVGLLYADAKHNQFNQTYDLVRFRLCVLPIIYNTIIMKMENQQQITILMIKFYFIIGIRICWFSEQIISIASIDFWIPN